MGGAVSPIHYLWLAYYLPIESIRILMINTLASDYTEFIHERNDSGRRKNEV